MAPILLLAILANFYLLASGFLVEYPDERSTQLEMNITCQGNLEIPSTAHGKMYGDHMGNYVTYMQIVCSNRTYPMIKDESGIYMRNIYFPQNESIHEGECTFYGPKAVTIDGRHYSKYFVYLSLIWSDGYPGWAERACFFRGGGGPGRTTRSPAGTTRNQEESTQSPGETTRISVETTQLPGRTTRGIGGPTRIPGTTTRFSGGTTRNQEDPPQGGTTQIHEETTRFSGGTTRPGGTSEETQRPEGTSEETPRPEGTSEETPRPEGTSEETPRPEGTSEETPRPEGTSEETPRPEGTSEETPRPEGTSEETPRPGGTSQATPTRTTSKQTNRGGGRVIAPGHIVSVTAKCDNVENRNGNGEIYYNSVHLVTDVHMSAVGHCQDDSMVDFTTDDFVNYYLKVYYNQSDVDPATEGSCIFDMSHEFVFRLWVEVSWGERNDHVHTYHKSFMVTCIWPTGDKRIDLSTVKSSIKESFINHKDVEGTGQFSTMSTTTLCVANILGQPLGIPSVDLGRTIRLRADSDGGLGELGISPVSCDAIGVNTNQRYGILRAGCGDGIIFPKHRGFITEGCTVLSPYFTTFALSTDSRLRFECNFTLCESNCDGTSCHEE